MCRRRLSGATETEIVPITRSIESYRSPAPRTLLDRLVKSRDECGHDDDEHGVKLRQYRPEIR